MNQKIYTRFTLLLMAIFLFSANLMAQTTIEVYIVDGNDDCEEIVTSSDPDHPAGEMDRTSSDLEIPFDNEPQIVGLLFRNLAIPANAVIDEATVRFDVDAVVPGTTDQPITVQIRAALVPNIDSILDEPFGISKYTMTTASVDWSPESSVEEHEKVYTSNFASVVQEVIDQAEWASGNNMMIAIAGDPNQTEDINREFEDIGIEDDGTIQDRTPMLTITYYEGTSIGEAATKVTSTVYPNPSRGTFYINNPAAGEYGYEVFNITGQSVARKNHLKSRTVMVDIKNLSQGIYFVDVETEGKTETHKLIVK
jgi:hypothetical protein